MAWSTDSLQYRHCRLSKGSMPLPIGVRELTKSSLGLFSIRFFLRTLLHAAILAGIFGSAMYFQHDANGVIVQKLITLVAVFITCTSINQALENSTNNRYWLIGAVSASFVSAVFFVSLIIIVEWSAGEPLIQLQGWHYFVFTFIFALGILNANRRRGEASATASNVDYNSTSEFFSELKKKIRI